MGALTLKVFSDELREWEFIEGEGIDPTDGFGVNLRLSIRENQIFLAEPGDSAIPWLTDKGRLFFDGMFEKEVSEPVLWESFLENISESMYFADHLNLQKFNSLFFIIVFENINIETLNMLYVISQTCSILKLRKVENITTNNDLESQFQLNTTTEKSKLHLSTLCLLLNTNTRYEGYLLNLNLRQRFFKGNFKLLSIGSFLDLTFPTYTLGSNIKIIRSISEGTHLFCQDFKNAEFPLIITNNEFFKRSDTKNFIKILKQTNIVSVAWNGLNILNHNLSVTGINSLNTFLPLSTEDCVNFFGLYFINVTLNATSNIKKLTECRLLNILPSKRNDTNHTLFIDQNNQNNKLVYEKIRLKYKIYDNYFYLPNSLFLEDSETFINTQGLIKRTTKLINFKKEAKNNWQITRKFYTESRKLAVFNNQKDNKLIVFNNKNLFNYKNYINFTFYAAQTLNSLSFYLGTQNKPINKALNTSIKATKIKLFDTKLKTWLDDFFCGEKDFFTRNSTVLADCSKTLRVNSTNFF
jgi:NADH dehydrogenase/NADH:ubiquinone oxidoreductase subunit G